MRRALTGYATLTEPMGQVKEMDTFTCAHCNSIRHVKPFCDPADLGGLCKCCMGVVCEQCVGRGCDPLEKKIQRIEKSQDFNRWFQEVI